jgi:phosphopantothenoylcysteine decarboxylase
VPSFGSQTGNVLYLVVCAAEPAHQINDLTAVLQGDGWDVCAVATPAAMDWIDADQLATLSGHPVRNRFRRPDDPEFEPRGDVVLAAPATFNTVNKWAAGISDNLALGLLNEGLGRGIPIAASLWLSDDLRNHPTFRASLAGLAAAGVSVSANLHHDPSRFIDDTLRSLRSATSTGHG